MNRLLEGIQKVAHENREPDLNDFFGYVSKQAEDNSVVVSRESNSTSPSSSSSKGMEDKQLDYGKGTTDNTEPDITSNIADGDPHGKPSEVHGGKNLTSEGSGMPDLSIGSQQHKTAAQTLKRKIALHELKKHLS